MPFRVFPWLQCCCLVVRSRDRSAAQPAYPAKTIRFIVPFPPGGGNDIVGRIVAQRLGEGLGQQVIVDNRGGAGGTIGTDLTAKAPPDGYTLLVNNISLAVNATLYPEAAVRHAEGPRAGHAGRAAAEHPGRASVGAGEIGARSARARAGEAAARSTTARAASARRGTSRPSCCMMMTQVRAGARAVQGPGPRADRSHGRARAGHRLDDGFGAAAGEGRQAAAARGHHGASARPSSRKCRRWTRRASKATSSAPGTACSSPAGTPRTIIDRLNRETAKVLGLRGAQGAVRRAGTRDLRPPSPEEFGAYLKSEVAKWGKVVKQSGAKPE